MGNVGSYATTSKVTFFFFFRFEGVGWVGGWEGCDLVYLCILLSNGYRWQKETFFFFASVQFHEHETCRNEGLWTMYGLFQVE